METEKTGDSNQITMAIKNILMLSDFSNNPEDGINTL
jgi:hypothetical protein